MDFLTKALDYLSGVFSNTLAFVVVLGVIIFVHEAGHMLMAKAFGVRVLTFSLGFGKRLWGFHRGDTDYRVSLIPLGGYVKMSGELPEESSEDPGDFLNKPRWQRFLVYLAGPMMNVVLAVVVLAILFMVGISVPSPDIPAEIGSVEAGSSAAAVGLQPGDRILKVNGQAVEMWDDAMALMLGAPSPQLDLEIRRGEEVFPATVTAQPTPQGFFDTAGILPTELPSVVQVTPDLPAATAGLRSGDQLRAVDGHPVVSSTSFIEYIQKHPEKPVQLDVQRNGQALQLTVVPLKEADGTGRIGLSIGLLQRYSPLHAVVKSVEYNIDLVRQTYMVLKTIVMGRMAADKALSGPIEIAKISGGAARVGISYLFFIMALISINIGIVNLLPIPILDGGQICILGIEGLMRRDLSVRVKEAINQVGFVAIMLLMLVVLSFDVRKTELWGFLTGAKPAEQTSPAAPPAP